MTELVTPFSETLRTDVYSLDISFTPAWVTPFEAFLGFKWMGLTMAGWLPSNDPMYYLAQYYGRWQYSVTVNTVRVSGIGIEGLTVTDSQVATNIVMTVSESPIAGQGVDGSNSAAVMAPYADAELDALGWSVLPSSLTFTYDDASWNARTGGSSGIPQGNPVLEIYLPEWVLNSQSPPVTIDESNTFNTGLTTLQKLIGNTLFPAINQGGIFDPQVTANAELISTLGGNILQATGSESLLNYFAGVGVTTFGLLLDRLNVPLGTLSCKSVNQTVFPVLPRLQVQGSLTGALFVSALANVTGWGGFRYLDFTARLAGFDPSQPLPRMMLGLVPTTKVSEATCAAALLGSPTFGNWYDVPVTEQLSTGQAIEIDTCLPIKGSGTWCAQPDAGPFVSGNPYAMPDPLGVGIWTNNPSIAYPGEAMGSGDTETVPSAYTFDTATLVLVVDASTLVQVQGANTYVDLSNFKFIEKTGSTLVIDIAGTDFPPVTPAGQPGNIESSSPTDGSLITVYRDGKPAVALRWLFAEGNAVNNLNPLPFLAYAYEPWAASAVDWSVILAGLNTLNNGYVWTFEPLYSNFMVGDEYPPSFLPVPSKFPPKTFKLGATVPIPIQARCTSYSNTAPWSPLQMGSILSGDDPVKVDNCTAYILCLSDWLGVMGFPVTVQSARIGPGAVVAIASNAAAYGPPVATSDFGPTTLTPDSNGLITISAGAPTSWALDSVTENVTTYAGYEGALSPLTVTFQQNELSPQIDGFLITFDEGLAQGQTTASGRLLTAYVPVRNGQTPAITYTPSLTSGTTDTDTGNDGQPSLMRGGAGAFCLRAGAGGCAKYSEPRHAIWKVTTDNRGRLVATLYAAFSPFPVQYVKYPVRSGSYVVGYLPHIDIYHAQMLVVYRRLDNVWVRAFTADQWTTLGEETILFNQLGGTMVTCEYDQSTGSQFYVMSLRNDGLSWLSAPTATTNPGYLPQVIVIRRHDAQGNSLPFVTTPTAAISGTVWENVLFTNQPTGGMATVQVYPDGTVLLAAGNEAYKSVDNGSNFTDSTGALVPSLTNMTSGTLPSGATGGTQIA